MKCIKCGCKELFIDKQEGFVKEPVKECKECGTIWFNDGSKNWVLYEEKPAIKKPFS